MAKLRVVKLIVAAYVVTDDGEHLHEYPVDPIEVPGSMVDDFVNGGLKKALDKLREQVEDPTP